MNLFIIFVDFGRPFSEQTIAIITTENNHNYELSAIKDSGEYLS